MKLLTSTSLKIAPPDVGAAAADIIVMKANDGSIGRPICDPPNHRYHMNQASIERGVPRQQFVESRLEA
mgnify:CR=1 FL=1